MRKTFFTKTLVMVSVVLLIEALIGIAAFRYFSLRDVERELQSFTVRVEQGLRYRNGIWDTSRYTSDPNTPHPSGSSGFSTPLYIIATDGFVIERNAPIIGLLDSADFKHLMAFQQPQTIKNITNEQWRIRSRPVTENGRTVGVIVVSVYNPSTRDAGEVDAKLDRNIQYIGSKLRVKSGEMNASAVDIRDIDYDVSFEIVSSFNKVILNNGRMPTYIDNSYVYNELREQDHVRVYSDVREGKPYMIVSRVLYDSSHRPIGIVMAGKSIDHINQVLARSFPAVFVTSLIGILALVYGFSRMLRNFSSARSRQEDAHAVRPLPKRLSFDKRTGNLSIDGQVLEIPYASNQYYLCKSVFLDPRKRWEVDELLEQFGQEPLPEHWRKVYDAMILLNKKAEQYMPVKLIELRDKTYQLNQKLLPMLSKSS